LAATTLLIWIFWCMHVNMLMRLTRVAQEFYCMFYCSCANPIYWRLMMLVYTTATTLRPTYDGRYVADSYFPSSYTSTHRASLLLTYEQASVASSDNSDSRELLSTVYRVGQLKWGQLTFVLVAFECVDKIQWFLANVNCIQQEVVWCKF